MDDPAGTSAEREAANGVKEEVPESLAHGHAANEVQEESIAIDMAPVLARLREILPQIDLATTTEKMLRKRLEGELSIDLSTEKAAIRSEIQTYLDSNAGAEEGEEEEEAAAAPKKRKSSVFNKEKRLSPALAAVIGSERASRPQVVKLLWVYIKANNLQNPSDKRKIILDEKLKAIFPRPVNAFSLNTYLSAHIMDDDECYGGEKAPKASKAPKEKASKKKVKKEDGDEDDDDDEEEEDDEGSKKRKRKSSGSAGKSSGGGGAANNNFNKPLALSAKLAAFIGKSSASRPEINSFINNYCKEHNLHNPANRQYIICNDVLQDLFEVDTFRSFGEPMKLIKPHVSKLE